MPMGLAVGTEGYNAKRDVDNEDSYTGSLFDIVVIRLIPEAPSWVTTLEEEYEEDPGLEEEDEDNEYESFDYNDFHLAYPGEKSPKYVWSLGLKSHVEDDTASTNPDWCQLDDLIKMWILSSLCASLQEQVVTTLGNAKALWDHLKDLFHDNKDNRVINLDSELRSIKIGTMTVNEYCTKI
nr:hybrid signal transduction histidine kinase M [Tanacetum cinerariifolium]